MSTDLQGRVALVTGAGRGIGRAVSLALARSGARVVLAARTAGQIDAVASEIARLGGEALAVPADVSHEPDVSALFGRVRERFQGRLDVLVNNAGVGIYGPLDTFAAGDFDRVLAVNLRGTFLCCREAMNLMEPRKAGWIVNVSSVVGFKGYPNQAAYTASKHGIMGLTKSLAVEAQPYGIRVSAVLPGGVDTELASAARPDLDRAALLQPEDIAQAVLYLLSLSDRAAVDQIYIRRRTSAPF
jgi:NAD(P)-dependent dehydrogenase (short-subunit alcohol dehydrogenase family)